ncbi:MAG: hypothetical protein IT370_14770 [Deltaproteobacteria bacterium]|nr:hypothetical protein [Deltaproteobacteria bacterium]
MVMHKVDSHMEAGGAPDQKIIQGMGRLVGDSLKEGIFLDGAGLHRSAQRVRLRFGAGECAVTQGPLLGERELVASMAMIKVASMEAAIGVAQRLAAALAEPELEIEIGPVVEAWDLGMMPKPEGLTSTRYLLLRKAGPGSEAGTAPRPEVAAEVARVSEELRQAGVLLSAQSLAPSASGARLARAPKGKRTWTDGPFTESKEMIAGFSVLGLGSLAEAKAWAERYADILDGNEVDVRLMVEGVGLLA